MEKLINIKFLTSLSIRINRTDFALKYLIFLCFFLGGNFLVTYLGNSSIPYKDVLKIIPISISFMFLVLCLISIKQRMNDLNFIKWYHFFWFLFVYIFILVLFFKKGTEEVNVFGPPVD